MSEGVSNQRLDRAATGERLCRSIAAFHAQRWCVGASGNFSVRLQDDPLKLLITRRGCFKGMLTADDLVVVGVDGRAIPNEALEPSTEALLHTTIATVESAGAVLHTHSVWSALLGTHYLAAGGFSIARNELVRGLAGPDHEQAEIFIPVIATSHDITALANRIVELLAEWPNATGFLIAGHGLYTWGANLEEAHRHVEILEFLLECTGRLTDFRAR